MAGVHATFEPYAGQACAERQAAAESLRERDDVRNDSALLEREERSGPPETALNFVEHEQCARAVGDFACGDQILVSERDDAALAHHRLEEDRSGLAIDGRSQRVDVIRRNERNAGHERLERLAIRVVAGERERAECAAVKAL